MSYEVEVKDYNTNRWMLLAPHKSEASAERSRKDAWKRGVDARIVKVTAKGEREVML